jgi:hypothetical protein
LKTELADAVSEEDLRWRQAQKLILAIAEGIKQTQVALLNDNSPVPDVSLFLPVL